MPKHIVFPIYFKGQRWGQLVIPDDISREDYELLNQQINNHCETIEGALLPPLPEATQEEEV